MGMGICFVEGVTGNELEHFGVEKMKINKLWENCSFWMEENRSPEGVNSAFIQYNKNNRIGTMWSGTLGVNQSHLSKSSHCDWIRFGQGLDGGLTSSCTVMLQLVTVDCLLGVGPFPNT